MPAIELEVIAQVVDLIDKRSAHAPSKRPAVPRMVGRVAGKKKVERRSTKFWIDVGAHLCHGPCDMGTHSGPALPG